MRTSNFVKIATTGTAWSQLQKKSLNLEANLPFPALWLLKKVDSNSNSGRDTSGSKQNLNALSLESCLERADDTHQITWIWSLTSFDFAFSWMKESTSSSSFLPPASNPGESWKMNPGLFSKMNSSRTLWTPRYGIKSASWSERDPKRSMS